MTRESERDIVTETNGQRARVSSINSNSEVENWRAGELPITPPKTHRGMYHWQRGVFREIMKTQR